jgi:NADH:ubiquinone oxidoreductase subunit B-like Fe-S oxidoreductase
MVAPEFAGLPHHLHHHYLRPQEAKLVEHDPLLHTARNVRDAHRFPPLEQIPYARGNSIEFVSFGLGCPVIEFPRYFDIFFDAL